MTNISELNLLDNKNIEDWNLSEDKKELTITYVNNTEEDMKIVDKFIIKDHVQNESKVDLEKHNIIVEAKKIIPGDIDENADITVTDLIVLKRHLIAGNKHEWVLEGDKLKAADTNQDKIVTITDLVLLKRMLLNKN